YICNLCEKVHACDIDERITSKKAMAEEILKDFGPVDAGILLEYAGKPRLSLQDITKTTYHSGMFDLIICISALEYLPNKQILAALSEFKRILKDGGLIAITLDYPVLEIKTLNRMLQGSGLTYASEVNFELPCNALNTDIYACGLYSFRALLKKAENP
ncbi:MAG: class I SAM-dependent methyltransferase, partial [Bacillota bacterium]|nr:class I SAM-dependent methyltransferase [Bacillota bacterium]